MATMRPFFFRSLMSLLLVAPSTFAAIESVLESSDFNVTKALVSHGVELSDIPALAKLTQLPSHGCAAACDSLRFLYGSDSLDMRNETAYDAFIDSFWSSNQAEARPHCVFKPSKAAEVSVFILLARLTQCPFAVRSGGHAAFAGASSIHGGITVSFAKLNDISLSEDMTIASIEPGNTWGTVFEELTKSDVTVVGGRVYNVGVGGLTTGGGISYLSNIHGWACDNVDTYEVVLANGIIAKVSATQHSDLYWALRGGGNNFGLVTRFHLKTIPLPKGEIWGGFRVYSEHTFPEVTKALIDIIRDSPTDPKAGFYSFWTINDQADQIAIPGIYYSEPNAGNATIWHGLNAIPAASDTARNRVIAEWAKEVMDLNPSGRREIYYDITTKVDQHIFSFARDVFYETLPSVAQVPGISPYFIVQGITTPQLRQMEKNGGNALGLDASNGPLLILQLAAMWDNKSDDATVYRWMSNVLERVSVEAKLRRVENRYVYMNYASQFQDVIASYGAGNKAKLKSVSKKYDPQQVFQALQPGHFKLDRAPLPNSGYFSI